jgi:hypothetical protein
LQQNLQQQFLQPPPQPITVETICQSAPSWDNLSLDQQNTVSKISNQCQGDLSFVQCLITGEAGTGKSTLLHYFARVVFYNSFIPIILAPSGVAANHIQGSTIHRYFNISRTEASHEIPECDPIRLALRLQNIRDNGRMPFFLVDESSMISPYLLETMSQSLQQATGNVHPYGQSPIIFFGDFGQLGPVVRKTSTPKYMWDATTNDYLTLFRVDMAQSVRQRHGQPFQQFLSLLRRYDDSKWKHREELNNFLWDHRWDNTRDDADHYVFLYSQVIPSQLHNHQQLSRLPGQIFTFYSIDGFGQNATDRQKKVTELQTGLPTILQLKVGARVMCLSNINQAAGIVNGAFGIVSNVQLSQDGILGSIVQVVFDNTQFVTSISVEKRSVLGQTYSRTQFPLSVAWASTIHKSQTLTLRKVAISIKDLFCPGLLYVAMSRVRDHQDIRILDYPPRLNLNKSHPGIHVPDYIREHLSQQDEQQWRATRISQLPTDNVLVEAGENIDDDDADNPMMDADNTEYTLEDHQQQQQQQ